MKRFIFLFVALLMLASCSITRTVGYRADLPYYVGKSYNDIVAEFGSPTDLYYGEKGIITKYVASPEIFTYHPDYLKNSQPPRVEFYFTEDDICYDVQVKNAEPVHVFDWIGTGTIVLLLLLLF